MTSPEPAAPQNPRSTAGHASIPAFLIAMITLGVIGLVSVFVVLPDNVLTKTMSDTARASVTIVWPQGWGFFTKDPDEPDSGAYVVAADGQIDSVLLTPQGRSSNVFGLNRSSRAQGPELAKLLSDTRDIEWLECTTSNRDCVETVAADTPTVIENTAPHPTLCGRVVLTEEQPSPWAYKELVNDHFRITSAVHLDITCTTTGA